MDVLGAQFDGAFALHGIPGIDRQIEDGVLQLIAIDKDVPGILGSGHVHLERFTQCTL
ncbi:hypothetical protein D9M71_830430 [compost metagenome]